MEQFSAWLSETPVSQAIQVNFWAIPTLQIVHILCLAVLFTLALMLSLRVLGHSWRELPAGVLAARYSAPLWTSLALLLLSGGLLIVAEPARTLANFTFWLKMSMVVVAASLTLAILAAATRGRLAGAHRAMSALVMLLWAAIIVAGRYIAYT